ncbi:protein HEG homolog 1 isoform X2 [Carassius gibelio]|uniref:protein HEG homolog 1 isoform X2 n=1 Tax=Carassius gibelio TaxID=101364 RepID=UPI002279334A|nr:protein HEG homolog 1 isoform X2 [Carassius gibelio]
MFLTGRLFLLIAISTSAVIGTSTVSTDSSNNSTDSPISASSTATVAVTSIPSENTTAPFTNNATTPPLSTHAGNGTSLPLSTQGKVTGSSTVAPEQATSSSVSTPGNATVSPAPVTTAVANSASPVVPTLENATDHPVTSPGNATTTPLPEPGNSTTPPQTTKANDTTPPISTPSNSTASPITTPSYVTVTTQTTTATCPTVTCPPLSVCVKSICQCVTGTIPLNNACVETKTFPSALRVNRTFVEAMNNPQSPEFQKIAKEIIVVVNEALRNQSNYISSTVTTLTPGSVVATVHSFFEPNSPVTQAMVTTAMTDAINNCETTSCGILANAQYKATNLCDQNPPPCDTNTTSCTANDGTPICTCKAGHVSSSYQPRSCTVCPSGYKAENNTCVRCPFGYSGFNCDDSSLLALVVVACVLGGILLIVILAVLIYICVTRCNKKSSSNYFNSPYPAEEFQAAWPTQGITRIPRVNLTSNSSIDATGNSLEMSEEPGKKDYSNGLSGSFDLTTDGMRTFKDINPTRYSYLVGHENPYFIHGDEKR